MRHRLLAKKAEQEQSAEAPSDPQDMTVEGTAPERLKSVHVHGGTGI